jgi:hypothetical protein
MLWGLGSCHFSFHRRYHFYKTTPYSMFFLSLISKTYFSRSYCWLLTSSHTSIGILISTDVGKFYTFPDSIPICILILFSRRSILFSLLFILTFFPFTLFSILSTNHIIRIIITIINIILFMSTD